MDVKQYLSEWSECYRKDFVENIMPFWMKNGLDRKHGGVYTCLDRDGTLMDTTKSVWFQGRFGFIAAYAYNNIEQNPEWYGYFHRDRTVAQPVKGNIFKGPFHIPRMMIRCHTLCKEILG